MNDTIKYTPATTSVKCPKCGKRMNGGAVTSKRPGKPEMVTIRCGCGHAVAKVIDRK